jgi:hypothetical protein
MADSVREMETKIRFFQLPEFSCKVRIRHTQVKPLVFERSPPGLDHGIGKRNVF